jgi:hypothetical protein
VPIPQSPAAPAAAANDPTQLSRDSYTAAEQQRRAAIAEQLRLQGAVRGYYSAIPYAFAARPPVVYVTPGAVRRAYRLGYWQAYRVGVDVYAAPAGGVVQQPTGHEKIWTSPNGYVYRPRYDLPPATTSPTTPVAPLPPENLAPPAAGTVPLPPIPEPPSQPVGPKEF